MNGFYQQFNILIIPRSIKNSIQNSTLIDLGYVDASSPSRSLSSASPPIQQPGTPTPPNEPLPEEKNPEYLKELQAERDNLESASMTPGVPEDESKTGHAIKLLEQGKH